MQVYVSTMVPELRHERACGWELRLGIRGARGA